MINLHKHILFISILSLISFPLIAFSSSSFLISQSAFKSHDYSKTLININPEETNNNKLLDQVIAAIVTDNLSLANNLANEILTIDAQNQEAYIVKLVNLYVNKKYDEIFNIRQQFESKNELIDFIFFNNAELKNKSIVSQSLVDIVISSFSNADQGSLNYNFLLFYISLGKIIDPMNERATLIKGELFQRLEKDKIARDIFSSIKPNSLFYIDAQINLAFNYLTFMSAEEAEKNIQKLLEKNDNNYSLRKILADFYRTEKKYELALPIYDQMINEKREDLWNIFYMRAICYERLGDWKRAEKDFLKSLDIKPDSPNVLNYLAYGWVEREIRLDQSLEMLQEAYKANPDSYYIIDSLAWAYFKKNELEQAAKLMEQVIDIAPGEAISLDHLGDIYYAMDRKREAIHFWQQALELAEPDDDIEEDIQRKLDQFNAG